MQWLRWRMQLQKALLISGYNTDTNNDYSGIEGIVFYSGAGWGGLFINDLGYTSFFGAASD